MVLRGRNQTHVDHEQCSVGGGHGIDIERHIQTLVSRPVERLHLRQLINTPSEPFVLTSEVDEYHNVSQLHIQHDLSSWKKVVPLLSRFPAGLKLRRLG